MKLAKLWMLAGLLWIGSQAQVANAAEVAAPATPNAALVDYVKAPDASYTWVKRREGKLGSVSYVELTLTSQTWHDIVWKHQLYILRPESVAKSAQGLMLIGGGSWKDEFAQPPAADAKVPGEATLLATIATQIQAPVAILLNVPQQPIFNGMREDEIISYTFEQYFKTQDPTWPLLLPMVKSAIRGMDTVQQFTRDEWKLDVQHFTLTGASKRGWTTWLTSAVDPRVNALAPMVIDMLNMEPQMKHQLFTWGKFSEQIQDYTNRGIQKYMLTQPGKDLRTIVDPFSYRSKLLQPKLILLGTNDRYWPLDALNLYWGELGGEKHVLYVPNNGHGLNDFPRIIGGIVALHREAAGDGKMAEMNWKHIESPQGMKLEVRCDVEPQTATLWSASSATRDFRDAKWTNGPIECKEGTYCTVQSAPEEGYRAFFCEATFDSKGLPYYLSTNLRILGGKDASQAAEEKKEAATGQ